MVALACFQLPTHPQLPPTPIDSIRDITGTEKAIACRISYKMIAI